MAVAVVYCRAPHTHIFSLLSLSLVAAAVERAAAGAATSTNIIIRYSIIAVEHLDFFFFTPIKLDGISRCMKKQQQQPPLLRPLG